MRIVLLHSLAILALSAPIFSGVTCSAADADADKLRGPRHKRAENKRKLEWIYDGEVICNNEWATNYDRSEIASDCGGGDSDDFLRDTDVCYSSEFGDYHRDNCPEPPDCSRGNDGRGCPMKLCLNRVPIPRQEEKFYVAIMKCIPDWENCDKCMCGKIEGGREEGDRCINTGKGVPDDDRVYLDCDNDSFKLIVDAKRKSDGTRCRKRLETNRKPSPKPPAKPPSRPTATPPSRPTATPPSQPQAHYVCRNSCGVKWDDKFWKDLSVCQQKNWKVLGWDQAGWNRGRKSESENYSLSNLDCFEEGAERAARELCYKESNFYGRKGRSQRCSRDMSSFPDCCRNWW